MERKLLISDLRMEYEGLFDSNDFFKLIEDWFKQNGYNKNELKHIERVTDKGKFINLEIMPWKEVNDYTRYEIYLRIVVRDLVEATVKKAKLQHKINKGKISISIDAFLATDIKHRWESRPLYFFLRTLFEKFVNREHISTFEKGLMNDVKNFHSEMKAYLNLGRYTTPA